MKKVNMKKWLRNGNFPLVPNIEYEPQSETFASEFSIQWLFFDFWIHDWIQFGIDITIDIYGVHLILALPYCHIKIEVPIPIPNRTKRWIDDHTTRKGFNE